MDIDKGPKKKKPKKVVEEEEEDDIVIEDDGMAAMQAMMGFGGFGTTHQKKVPGNDVGAAAQSDERLINGSESLAYLWRVIPR
ncbi:u4 tri-snrnp-associated 3 protein [Rutstroemia sp. NJR-2017a BBW]|nr:u4 tri-snrnp-associated 3 protein [Rutstroemia sp. NJR-2017a BBW]